MASLVNTFPQAFLEVLHHSLQHVGRNCCHFFRDVLFWIHRCPWFLFIHLTFEIFSEEEILRLGTLVPINIEVPTNILWVKTESLFVKYVSTAKARCSTDQRSMATEMLWVSLKGRSRTNSPCQRFHSQLCHQIVRYFCRTLYIQRYISCVDLSSEFDPAGRTALYSVTGHCTTNVKDHEGPYRSHYNSLRHVGLFIFCS